MELFKIKVIMNKEQIIQRFQKYPLWLEDCKFQYENQHLWWIAFDAVRQLQIKEYNVYLEYIKNMAEA